MWLLRVKYSSGVLNALLPLITKVSILHLTKSTNTVSPDLTQLNIWPRLCRAKSTLVFCVFFFGTLEHFKVDCKAEEFTQGEHLIIMMMDTSPEARGVTSIVKW